MSHPSNAYPLWHLPSVWCEVGSRQDPFLQRAQQCPYPVDLVWYRDTLARLKESASVGVMILKACTVIHTHKNTTKLHVVYDASGLNEVQSLIKLFSSTILFIQGNSPRNSFHGNNTLYISAILKCDSVGKPVVNNFLWLEDTKRFNVPEWS